MIHNEIAQVQQQDVLHSHDAGTMVTVASVRQLSLGDSEVYFSSSGSEPLCKGFQSSNFGYSKTIGSTGRGKGNCCVDYGSGDDDNTTNNNYYTAVRLNMSHSTPTQMSHSLESMPSTQANREERLLFLKEIGQARAELVRFRNEMHGLAQQINGIETDLRDSKDRVNEIEEDLTATQEVNVNLQVILERAVHQQKECDVVATRAMRHIHADLASVVYDTTQLQDRLKTIANYQREHAGSVSDVVERMREYVQMLEQAHGTIQMLQESKPGNVDDVLLSLQVRHGTMPDYISETSSTVTEDDEEEPKRNDRSAVPYETLEIYRHRIIRKRSSLPGISTTSDQLKSSLLSHPLPQQGLRLLLTDTHPSLTMATTLKRS